MVLEPEVKSKSFLLGSHYLKDLDREKSDPGLLFFQRSHIRFQEHLWNPSFLESLMERESLSCMPLPSLEEESSYNASSPCLVLPQI